MELTKHEIKILSLINTGHTNLRKLTPNHRKNKTIALAAVTRSGIELQYVMRPLKENFDIVMAAVTNNGLALAYASQTLRKNHEIVLTAVSENGGALQYADRLLTADEDIVRAALTSSKYKGASFCYASPKLKSHRDLIILSLATDPRATAYGLADISLQSDKTIVRLAVQGHSKMPEAVIRYMPTSLKWSLEKQMGMPLDAGTKPEILITALNALTTQELHKSLKTQARQTDMEPDTKLVPGILQDKTIQASKLTRRSRL